MRDRCSAMAEWERVAYERHACEVTPAGARHAAGLPAPGEAFGHRMAPVAGQRERRGERRQDEAP